MEGIIDFTPRTNEIKKEWREYYNTIAIERFGDTYGNIEKNYITRNFINAYAFIQHYLIEYNSSYTELNNDDVERIIWASPITSNLQKMRPHRPFIYEQTKQIVIVAALLKEINSLLGTTTSIQDCGLAFTEDVICPHCNKTAILTDISTIKPERSGQIYLCEMCGAFCYTHENTNIPLGVPGNELERNYRSAVHKLFDIYWKENDMSRDEAYAWLAGNIGIFKKDCHIGRFDIFSCKQVLKVIGLPDNLEIDDYWVMINTNDIPWGETPFSTSHEKLCENADPLPDKKSELPERIVTEQTSIADQKNRENTSDYRVHHQKIMALLGKYDTSELIEYINKELPAEYSLKRMLIDFISEYTFLGLNDLPTGEKKGIKSDLNSLFYPNKSE